MGQSKYVVEAVDGHPRVGQSHRRGVAFLVCAGDSRVTAKDSFENLSSDAINKLHSGIDCWLGGSNKPKLFHGWDKSQFGGKYIFCFVFKSRDKQAHRFYGFLCNPSQEFPRFQLCVLIFHETKDENATDPSVLKRVELFRVDPDVENAVSAYIKSLIKELGESQ
jgi:hypothetical protein